MNHENALSLDDAWDKLRWARHHFEILRGDAGAFLESSNHYFLVEKDVASGCYTFRVYGLNPLPNWWGHLIGDCVHNARASLDYLMTRLVSIATGEAPADIDGVQFPIYWEQDGKTAPAAKRFQGDAAVGTLRQHSDLRGYLTRIEELQPFNNANPSIWGQLPVAAYGGWTPVERIEKPDGTSQTRPVRFKPNESAIPAGLQTLATFSNIDKHRSPIVPWYQVSMPMLVGTDPYRPLAAPSGYEIIGANRSMRPLLEDGTEVGALTFEPPIDGSWTPTERAMRSWFPLQVSAGQGSTTQSLIGTLEEVLLAVEAVLRIFRPAFAKHRGAPLPVTSVGLRSQATPQP